VREDGLAVQVVAAVVFWDDEHGDIGD
jgi:hypothetical protein